ncbi:hypothetical protein [Ideonella sp. A 288]|uniref:hypothetical protein n=1 Tax=Ideonella sp. A 288 TaxID=1962181 RepID=UPI000B4AE715|nr:hypothetical protein [Ideonella sp. A 288]
MADSRIIRHKEYDLHCSARAVDGGLYAPVLVAVKATWPTRPRTIEVPRGHHQDEASAIEAARTLGIEWVSNYG